jgi:type III pantothenate kinase
VTPDIVVDVGNSRMKWGRCEGGKVTEMVSLPHDSPVEWKRQAEVWGVDELTRWTIAGVAPQSLHRFSDWLSARGVTPKTITSELFEDGGPTELATAVEEISRIGVDRLLTSLAAYSRSPPSSPVAVINVGTAMTIDFVTRDGVHVGGVILPGPQLMTRSLHAHTVKLPLIEIDPVLPVSIWVRNTEEAIELGIANAILGAADQLVWDWAAHAAQPPWVYAAGGDVGYFRGFVFTADVAEFVIDPHLTLEGIRLAAEALA